MIAAEVVWAFPAGSLADVSTSRCLLLQRLPIKVEIASCPSLVQLCWADTSVYPSRSFSSLLRMYRRINLISRFLFYFQTCLCLLFCCFRRRLLSTHTAVSQRADTSGYTAPIHLSKFQPFFASLRSTSHPWHINGRQLSLKMFFFVPNHLRICLHFRAALRKQGCSARKAGFSVETLVYACTTILILDFAWFCTKCCADSILREQPLSESMISDSIQEKVPGLRFFIFWTFERAASSKNVASRLN